MFIMSNRITSSVELGFNESETWSVDVTPVKKWQTWRPQKVQQYLGQIPWQWQEHLIPIWLTIQSFGRMGIFIIQ